MRHFLLTLLILLLTLPAISFATYSTPGNNSTFTLADLVTNSSGAVTFNSGVYEVNDTIIISSTDTLKILTDETVKFATGTYLGVFGVMIINPPTGVLFTAIDTTARFLGVRIDQSNTTVIRKLTMEYANSLRLFESNIIVDSCTFQYCTQVANWGNSAINLFNSNPVIKNSKFLNNRRAAIQGGANISNAPHIEGNYFSGNNMMNQNVPQINLGATGTDTAKIINNQILRASTNSGGIAFLPLGNANILISGNEIISNRYGITLQGGTNINARISHNTIDSNNTQNSPNLGGSGLNFIGGGPQNTIVTNNTIRWNLWGVTIQGTSKPNLGNILNADTTDDGRNYFWGNGNSDEWFDLYNNTPDSIYAQNNNWGVNNIDSVEARIFHQPDDSTLGLGFVIYTPIIMTNLSQEMEIVPADFLLEQNFPNPFNPETTIRFSIPRYSEVKLEVYDINGKLVSTLLSGEFSEGTYSVRLNASGLASGIYVYKLTSDNFTASKKLLLLK